MTEPRSQLRIAAYTADPWESACPVLRITGPCEMAGVTVLRGTHWAGDELLSEVGLVDEADLVIIQRDFPRYWEKYEDVVAHARAKAVPVVYELDDLLFGLPESHADWRHYRDARVPMLRAALEADAITASTPALCAALAAYHGAVHLLPNTLDDRLWSLGSELPASSDGPVVIGYMGGGTHQPDVAIVGPALYRVIERFGARVAIRFMGRTPPPEEIRGLPNVTWERVAFLDYSSFSRWFAVQRVDIGLAPLEDTSFNRGKSGIKFLEYTAVGAASVCSRVPAYLDSVGEGEGLLVGSGEWEEALIRLVTDEALRRQLAEAAREGVRRKWLLSHRAAEWIDVYAHVCAAPRDETRGKLALALDTLLDWQQDSVALLAQVAEYRRQVQDLESHAIRQEEALRWREAELRQMRDSITWRGTEPVRRAYARLQRLTRASGSLSNSAPGDNAASAERPLQRRDGSAQGASAAATAIEPDAAVEYRRERFFWSEAQFAAVPALSASPMTDVILCVGPNLHLTERCISALRQNTDSGAYRLRLVIHEKDRPALGTRLTDGADVIIHQMEQFNFARANNLGLARCPGDVVLLNDDTEVTPGWLEQLRYDSRGFALTAARTGVQRSGNPDLWGEGDSRLTWYPVNMFCAFMPARVRQVVGALEEEFAYYGGEDVDYSCRALQHGFPLAVSSAFVHHAGTQSFGPKKDRLMHESDKILIERYGLRPPFDLTLVKPLTSVIVATRNRAQQLLQAAQSILTGLYPQIELIIVDDASTDETPQTVAALQATDSRVIGIRLPKQGGSVRARQRGVAASRGQFIAFMDDDDTAWPNRILAPLQHLMTRPELDAVYCAFDIVSESGRTRGRTQPFSAGDYLDMKFDIGLGLLLLRRQLILDVPLMAQYERAIDFDWVFRVVRHGYKIDYCPAVVLDYNRFGPADAHLSGNETAIRVHQEIQDRERLMREFGRK